MIDGTATAEGRGEMTPGQRAPGKPAPSAVHGRERARRTTALVVTLPLALVVGQAVVWWLLTPAARPTLTPPPALQARFDALLAGAASAAPGATRLPPPTFSRTTLYALRPGRQDEPVWIADAHAEGAWGVRIVLSADTGAVKIFSSEVWAACPPDRSVPPQIRTKGDARSAARRFLLWLGKPAVGEAGLSVTAPAVLLPGPWGVACPWGTWYVRVDGSEPRQRWRLALDGQTGNLLDFREETAIQTGQPNP